MAFSNISDECTWIMQAFNEGEGVSPPPNVQNTIAETAAFSESYSYYFGNEHSIYLQLRIQW